MPSVPASHPAAPALRAASRDGPRRAKLGGDGRGRSPRGGQGWGGPECRRPSHAIDMETLRGFPCPRYLPPTLPPPRFARPRAMVRAEPSSAAKGEGEARGVVGRGGAVPSAEGLPTRLGSLKGYRPFELRATCAACFTSACVGGRRSTPD